MGTFNKKIVAEFNPPRKWILARVLSYKNKDINFESLEKIGVKVLSSKISVPKGFVTDLASVPRIVWNIIAPWDIARAAIIHDLLYLRIRLYRAKPRGLGSSFVDMRLVKKAKKAADNVFLMAMKDASPDVSSWKIYASYYAVVVFGRWSIIPRDGDNDQM